MVANGRLNPCHHKDSFLIKPNIIFHERKKVGLWITFINLRKLCGQIRSVRGNSSPGQSGKGSAIESYGQDVLMNL